MKYLCTKCGKVHFGLECPWCKDIKHQLELEQYEELHMKD